MPHKIDLELTSNRGDGTWTWRAARAREPRGVVAAALLQPVAKVGDVLRAEVEVELDGITVLSVVPPRQRHREEPERLELLGPLRPQAAPPAKATSARRPVQSEEGTRGASRSRGRPAAAGQSEDQSGPGDGRRPRRAGRTERGPGREPTGESTGRRAPQRRRVDSPERAPSEGPVSQGGRQHARRRHLVPGHTHRDAVLDSLPAEQRPVAEQVLRAGIPAVRQAVEAENLRARAEHRPEIQALPLLSLAEELRPRLQAAAWRDRAEAAAAAVDEIPLRELRSVVAASDSAPHDQESRLLAATLREALDRRAAELRQRWTDHMSRCLDEGDVRGALVASATPPDPQIRLPAELAVRLGAAAGQALSPDLDPVAWSGLLEAVAASPVRRVVKPAGLPHQRGDELLQMARQLSGRVPGLAGLLGIDMPPPPGPPRLRGRPARAV